MRKKQHLKSSRENKVNHMQRIRTLKLEINTILHQDELFWQQRSRSIWLPIGDKNTKFFHQRRRKNHISGIQDVDGSWKTSEDQITQVAENYFQKSLHFSKSHGYGECTGCGGQEVYIRDERFPITVVHN